MFKKTNNILFVFLFLVVLFIPLVFTKWESGGVSVAENRNLAKFPAVMTDGRQNGNFTKDFEKWFRDHMGFRDALITANMRLQQNVFDRSISTSDIKIGKTGDYIYASHETIKDFAHANLWTEEMVANIGQSYQTVSDWLAEKGIPFFYVQCVDKHTIYPERFIASVNQLGTVSKTDQVITYLRKQTDVNTIYFKEVLAENRTRYDVFSHWGDSTHWTPRGAYISYTYMMISINEALGTSFKCLQESDYEITMSTLTGPEGGTEQVENFNIRNPRAQKTDISALGNWAGDHRHAIWKNPDAPNDCRLLIMGDSYFEGYLVDDIAESFSEVWLVWGDYTADLIQVVEHCEPDIVIYECAERVDRSWNVYTLANDMHSGQ